MLGAVQFIAFLSPTGQQRCREVTLLTQDPTVPRPGLCSGRRQEELALVIPLLQAGLEGL